MKTNIGQVFEKLDAGRIQTVFFEREETWVLLDYISQLRKRIKQLKITIQGDIDIPNEMKPWREELNSRTIGGREYFEFAQQYILPVGSTPGLMREAFAYIQSQGLQKKLKRIFYHPKTGYVAVFVTDLIRKNELDCPQNIDNWQKIL
jgi:hypothetical protein